MNIPENLKTIAFIDAANIIYGAKRESGFKVDLKKLTRYLTTRFGTTKIYFYGGVNTQKIDFEKYRQMLCRFGVIPRLKKTKFYYQKAKTKTFVCRFCQKRNWVRQKPRLRLKANCDVDLAMDVLENLGKYQRFIFLTGDGDFGPVLAKVKANKKEVYVIAAARKTAKSIRKIAAEKFIEIKYLKRFIEAKNKEATLLKSQPPVFVKRIPKKKGFVKR